MSSAGGKTGVGHNMRTVKEPIIPVGLDHVYRTWHIAPAVRVGNLIVCSGVLGQRPDGTVPSDPAEQFTLAFENLRNVLAAGGAELTDLVELVTFHIDLEKDLESFTAVKDEFVHEPYPAWTAVGVAQLGAGLRPTPRVEIKATAHLADPH